MTPRVLIATVAWLAAASPAHAREEPPAFCARLLELVGQGTEDTASSTALDEALALLPMSSGPIAAQVRGLASQEEGRSSAWRALSLAAADSCQPLAHVDAPVAAADAARIMAADRRFGGVREGDDVLDRLLHKLWLALAGMLESDGMRRYAEGARTLYFALTAVVVLVVALRIARALRAQRTTPQPADDAAAVEGRRRRAFEAWRKEADGALAAGDARSALRAGQAALLARLGEIDDAAVTPARTHREIAARLEDALASVVLAPLRSFDVSYFGKAASLDDASRFLAEVDDAERRLPRVAGGPALRRAAAAAAMEVA